MPNCRLKYFSQEMNYIELEAKRRLENIKMFLFIVYEPRTEMKILIFSPVVLLYLTVSHKEQGLNYFSIVFSLWKFCSALDPIYQVHSNLYNVAMEMLIMKRGSSTISFEQIKRNASFHPFIQSKNNENEVKRWISRKYQSQLGLNRKCCNQRTPP